MNLWLSTQFLVAGLFLSSWALTPEECRPLITPLSLKPSMMFGRSNFLFGYTDNEFYNEYLKHMESYWIDINHSSSSPKTIVMTTGNKLNGSCLFSVEMINIQFLSLDSNFSASFHMLTTCDDCLLYSFNRTATNLDKMLEKMELNIKHSSYVVVLSPARGTTVKDSDLEHFRKQASCLGFNREPDFIYDPKNDFCSECEGRKIPEYHN
uniref:Uncharacterized protein n=1 Tax=Cyclopterus lumpus TaxID=8103 RepID=A0A8C3FXG7_CYCLU